MRILVTGFEPFGGENTNPSWQAVRELPDVISGAEIVKVEVPVVFKSAGLVLAQAVEAHKPDIVLCVGEAGGAEALEVERIGINLIDARIADNDGQQPIDVPIHEDGPAAYFATLPVKAMVERIREEGISANLSYSAGSYVCNTLLYEALYLAERMNPGMKAGFIHVPYIPEQVEGKPDTPFMALSDITKGLQAAIIAAVSGKESRASMGELQ